MELSEAIVLRIKQLLKEKNDKIKNKMQPN